MDYNAHIAKSHVLYSTEIACTTRRAAPGWRRAAKYDPDKGEWVPEQGLHTVPLVFMWAPVTFRLCQN